MLAGRYSIDIFSNELDPQAFPAEEWELPKNYLQPPKWQSQSIDNFTSFFSNLSDQTQPTENISQHDNDAWLPDDSNMDLPMINTSNMLIEREKVTQNYCDITKMLSMPQSKAAQILGIPTSTLSKRWKEAVQSRKWPWRNICKIDREISEMLQNIAPNGTVPPSCRNRLAILIRKRNEELRPVVIRL